MLDLNIPQILLNIPVTLLALSVHECAHGWVSSKLGDPTPRYQGRLSLNPLAHLDPVGTLLMILTGFGWAKPVQVNPNYYKNTKKGMALVAAAGPLSNFLMAVIGMILLTVFSCITLFMTSGTSVMKIVYMVLQRFILLNINLMVFNLIPIPPLDGSKVLGMFLPNDIYYKMLQYERYSMIIIMLLSLTGMLNNILGFGVNAVIRLITLPFDMIVNLIISVV